MNEDLERELRAGLLAAAVLPPPPADLADRAERTAGRIRRRRYAAVAVAAVLALVVPLAVVNTVRRLDRSLPPAVNPACRVDPTPPVQEPARTVADITAWTPRVDPALRPRFAGVFRDWSRYNTNQDTTDPRRVPSEPHLLFAHRASGWGSVYAFATSVLGEWRLGVITTGSGNQIPLVNAPMPKLGPGTVLSGLVNVDYRRGGPLPSTGWDRRSNLLFVLAAPGTPEIRFSGCYRTQPFTVSQPGDVLFREVGAMDAVGRLTVRNGERMTFTGAPGLDPSRTLPLVIPAVEPIPVPDGYRALQPDWPEALSQAEDRGASWMYTVNDVTVRIEGVSVLVRCLGAPFVDVQVSDLNSQRDAVAVPCDGLVHTSSEAMVVGSASQVDVSLDSFPGYAPPPAPTSVRILVVEPIR